MKTMQLYLVLGGCLLVVLSALLLAGCGGSGCTPDNLEDAIVYMSDPDYEEVWFMFADGSGKQLIAGDDSYDFIQGVLSPDGRKVLYVHDDYETLVEYDLGTGNRVTILDGEGDQLYTPAYSPDGLRISFSREGNDGSQDLWIMSSNGGDPVQITDDGDSNTNDTLSSWSTDGNTIYFQRGRRWWGDICRLPAGVGSVTVIKASDAGADLFYGHPRVLPNGKLLFMKSTGQDEQQDIYVMNADGSGEVNLTPNTPDSDEFFPSCNRAGTKVVYASNWGDGEEDIFIADFNGSSLSNKANLTSDVSDDCWRPSLGAVDRAYMLNP